MSSKKRYLYLLRHAKAEKGWPELEDVDRPLHPVGVDEAHRMAKMFSASHPMPQLVITSPAVRTYSTALIFSKVMGYDFNQLVLDHRIYNAPLSALMQVIAETPVDTESILVVGHNPSMTQLAHFFADDVSHMSTSSIIGFGFIADDWMHFDIANAEVVCRLFP